MAIDKLKLLKLLVSSVETNYHKRATRELEKIVNANKRHRIDPLYQSFPLKSFHMWAKPNFQAKWLERLDHSSSYAALALITFVLQLLPPEDRYLVETDTTGQREQPYLWEYLQRENSPAYHRALVYFIVPWAMVLIGCFKDDQDKSAPLKFVDALLTALVDIADAQRDSLPADALAEVHKLADMVNLPQGEEKQRLKEAYPLYFEIADKDTLASLKELVAAQEAAEKAGALSEDADENSDNIDDTSNASSPTTSDKVAMEVSVAAETPDMATAEVIDTPLEEVTADVSPAEVTPPVSSKPVPTSADLARSARGLKKSKRAQRRQERQAQKAKEAKEGADVAVSAVHLMKTPEQTSSLADAVEKSMRTAHQPQDIPKVRDRVHVAEKATTTVAPSTPVTAEPEKIAAIAEPTPALPDTTPTQETPTLQASVAPVAPVKEEPASVASVPPTNVVEATTEAAAVTTTPTRVETAQPKLEVWGTDAIREVFPITEKVSQLPPVERGLTRTLGYIRRYGNFINFFGVANWSETYERFIAANFEAKWPSYGSVMVSSYTHINLADGAFYVLDWEANDLRANVTSTNTPRDDYVYRIEYDRNRVYKIEEAGAYVVVYPMEDNPNFQKNIYIKFQRDASVEDMEYSRYLHLNSVPVLLAIGSRYYGPLNLREDSAKRPYVNLQLGVFKGLVHGYERNDQRDVLIKTAEICWADNSAQGLPYNVAIDVAFVHQLRAARFDLLSEQDLLDRLSPAVTSNKEQREQFEQWVDNHLAANDLFCDDADVRLSRQQKIMRALKNSQNNDLYLDQVVSLLSHTINHRAEDKVFFESLVAKLTEDPQLMRRLESHRKVAAQLQAQEDKLAQVTARYDQLEGEINTRIKSTLEEMLTKNATLLKQNEQLEAECQRKQEKLGILDEVSDLATTRKTLSEDVARLQAKQNELENLALGIDKHLSDAINNPQKYAFDGAIASKLLEAASLWEMGKQKHSYEDRARAVAAVNFNPLTGKALIEDLVKKVQRYRAYDSDTILNFFILLTQNFLTIFSGPPGVGKTSICEILGHVLGLTQYGDYLAEEHRALWASPLGMSRFLPVSVERGWTSKRDFVGYYNPLSKTFESIDPLRREAFAELDAEKRLGLDKAPFLMLLDEANLSPMEYYWGDFMRLCDKRSGATAFVSLGGNAQYSVPDTLRFVATINNDFTTENLSPRLLDRASIVTLPELETCIGVLPETDEAPCLPVSWAAMQSVFGPQEKVREDVNTSLDTIYQSFERLGMPVSMRTRIAIRNYVSAADAVFSQQKHSSFVKGIDFAISQRLLPRINGNGEGYRAQLEELKSLFEGYGYDISTRLLEEMIDRGRASMDWYRFF